MSELNRSGQLDPGSAEAELRRRLYEAEETLRAIREGEVDALVVRGSGEDAVFALGGENSYRDFMEAMDTGAAALDAESRLIYANKALSNLLGADAHELQQADLTDRFGASGAAVLRRLMRESSAGRRTAQLALPTPGGERHLDVTVAPLDLPFGRGFALTFTDVTERVESAAASESERIGRALLASSNEAVLVCNENGIITQANAQVRQFHDGSAIGRPFDEAFRLSFPVSVGLISSTDLIDLALSGSSVRGVEATLAQNNVRRSMLISAGPLRSGGETVAGCLVALSDVTEQRAAESKQRLLMGELTHRVKNTLTLVLSIANRTGAGTKNFGEFRTAFSRRLEALAATHNLLAEDFSSGLTLEDLAIAELTPYIAPGSERLALKGLEYRLTSDVAVTLGLILHELVTNAVKYGALSNERGCVSLTADRKDDAIEIIWCEQDGPPVVQPERHGFGQTLILRGLGQTAAGETTIDYRPEGVLCRMYVPLGSVMSTAA